MDNKANKALLKTKKVPFGIICGVSGIIVFFTTVGLVLAYVVLSGIAEQTNKTISFFENWWQVLLFVVLIIAALTAIAAFVMFILKRAALIAEGDEKYFEYIEESEPAQTDGEISSEPNEPAAEIETEKGGINA